MSLFRRQCSQRDRRCRQRVRSFLRGSHARKQAEHTKHPVPSPSMWVFRGAEQHALCIGFALTMHLDFAFASWCSVLLVMDGGGRGERLAVFTKPCTATGVFCIRKEVGRPFFFWEKACASNDAASRFNIMAMRCNAVPVPYSFTVRALLLRAGGVRSGHGIGGSGEGVTLQ